MVGRRITFLLGQKAYGGKLFWIIYFGLNIWAILVQKAYILSCFDWGFLSFRGETSREKSYGGSDFLNFEEIPGFTENFLTKTAWKWWTRGFSRGCFNGGFGGLPRLGLKFDPSVNHATYGPVTVIEKSRWLTVPTSWLVYFWTLYDHLPFGIGKPSILTFRYLVDSWWLKNQPIWKIWKSQIGSFLQIGD